MKKIAFDFASKFPLFVPLSALAVIASVVLIMTKGLNYGVDFRGGAEVQVKFQQEVELVALRKSLKQEKFVGAVVQRIGERAENEFLIKVQADEQNLNQVTQKISNFFESTFKDQGAEIRKTDIVGPKAGKVLRNSGIQAMLWAFLAIMIYVGLRFDFKYAPGAIVALFHDVIIIVGIFVLTQKEFTLQIIAALLAVIGYSVNDTVVIYDRVREHEESFAGSLKKHLNKALSETLSRTLLTSLTTLFVSLTMFFFGGLVIKDFFFAITIGVFLGTYSSLFVAAPVTLFLDKFKKEDSPKLA